MRFIKQYREVLLISLVLFFFSLVYRIYGLADNHPFWVDEFAAADQARVFLKHGVFAFLNPKVYLEHHNITSHFAIAGAFRLLGQSEGIARIPFAIGGSLVTVAIYLYAKQLFGKGTALTAALLNACSYMAITWSRQARGYPFLQLAILATLILSQSLINHPKYNKKYKLVALCGVVLFGIATHTMYYLFLMVWVCTLLFQSKARLILQKHTRIIFTILILTAAALFLFRAPQALYAFFRSNHLGANNVWYYHSFLWREYGLITFLAILGWAIAASKNVKGLVLPLIYALVHLIFLFFGFKPYVSRYLLPVFPFIFIGMGYTIVRISGLLTTQGQDGFAKSIRNSVAFLIAVGIIANGNLFSLKPKKFYSVNKTFREIALIDYNAVYNKITGNIKEDAPKPAVVDTWPARTRWYLGQNYESAYLLRWNEEGLTNGLSRSTPYTINKNGEKILEGSGEKLVLELEDLQELKKKYPKGYMFIDDASLPAEIIMYAEKNFTKEIFLDHYTLDDNPYSLWPATLYSWGME